jgi:glucose/mannose-6-phosphate isomerase
VTHQQYLDTLGMWDATLGLPEQITSAVAASEDVLHNVNLTGRGTFDSVALFGMGTSGLAADLAVAFGAGRASVPLWAGKSYDVPAFVGPRTLVFAISASGDTEETVTAATVAQERGATVVVISRGGALAGMAAASEFPQFTLPTSVPVARTALGFLVVPVLATLARIGVLPDVGPSLAAAAVTLGRRRDVFSAPHSEPAEVARLVGRTLPLIYGSTGISGIAARRWKTQVNENAKIPAFVSEQPELSHNEVAGWGQHGDVTRQVFSLVTLRHTGEHSQVARRFDLVVAATDEVMANVIPVWADGDDDLGRFFDLALFGDLVSLHMAGREGIDPGPVPAAADVRAGLG